MPPSRFSRRHDESHGITTTLASATSRHTYGGFRLFGQEGSPFGMDVKIVSTRGECYAWDWKAQTVAVVHRECNHDVHQINQDHQKHFKGFAQIPMEHVPADIRIDLPVAWVLGLKSPTHVEKEEIVYKNLETLLGL
jgi:hypothetical protein